MKKFVNLMILLLAISVLFVSCEEVAPRATNSEDEAIVSNVVDDVKATSEDEEAGKKAIGPYLDVIINGLFRGDGTTIDGVNMKFSDSDYKYVTADHDSVNFDELPLTITFTNVDIKSGSLEGKKVNGTINYDETEKKFTGSVTCDGVSYTADATEQDKTLAYFYDNIFSENIQLECAKDLLAQGITLKGDKLKVYVKGTIEYEYGKDEDGNANGKVAFKKISITDFSLETKEDIQLTKNKYSLVITGTTDLDFTPKDDCSGEELTTMSINASMKMGISNETESHSLEVSSTIGYPSAFKLPVSFTVTNAKIDGQLITNESMYTLVLGLLVGILNS